MSRRRDLLGNFRLYAVTDLRKSGDEILGKIDAALKGGVDVIQLRSKTLSAAELLRLGVKIRGIANRRRKLFIVNDRIDIAIGCDADGVHLGQEDLPVALARRLFRDASRIVGKSTHSVAQAVAAQKEGADYLGFGPVFSTPTKPDYREIGLGNFGEIRRKIRVPVVAIGGIGGSNIENVLSAGAGRVAVVRAVFSASDPECAARNLERIMMRYEMPVL